MTLYRPCMLSQSLKFYISFAHVDFTVLILLVLSIPFDCHTFSLRSLSCEGGKLMKTPKLELCVLTFLSPPPFSFLFSSLPPSLNIMLDCCPLFPSAA